MKRVLVGLGAACVLAVCIAGIVLVARVLHQQATMRRFIALGPANLAREEAAARQEGIPLSAGQLQRPLPPPSQNAAPLYVKLTKLLHDKPLHLPKYAEGMYAFHAYTPQQVAAVRKALASRQDVMTLVHRAADRPQCVFVRDWGKGLDLTFPEYQPMREAARLVETESYLLARDGRYAEAVSNQARGFHIAKHAASDPVLISYLVGNACESITLAGMQSILALAGPNAAVSGQVQRATRSDFAPLPLRVPIVNEAAAMEPVFRQLHQGQHQGIHWLDESLQGLISGKGIASDPQHSRESVSPVEEKLVSYTIDVQRANYLSDVRRMVAAADVPSKERRVVYATPVDASAPSARDGARTMSFILLPDGQKLDEDDVRLKAREAVTLAAAALLAERARTAAYSGGLPQGFLDPFTSKPLLYRREGGGFAVYSVGPTGHFDGGRPGQKVPGQESLFRYPAVPVPPI